MLPHLSDRSALFGLGAVVFAFQPRISGFCDMNFEHALGNVLRDKVDWLEAFQFEFFYIFTFSRF